MDFLSLKYFIIVAEQLSFTNAAKKLYISQPTLSRQISNLESSLNIKLFKRNTHYVELTQSGEWFLSEAKKVILHTETLLEKTRQLRQGYIGSLHIGYSGNVGHQLLSQTLTELHKDYPNLDMYIYRKELGFLKEMLESGEIDLMFNLEIGLEKYPDIVLKKIIKNTLMAVVPKNHSLSNRKSIYFSELSNEDFILLDRNVSNLTMDTFTHLCIEHNFYPNITRQPTNLQSACIYVEAGFGISLISSEINKLKQYNLSFLPINNIDINYDIVVAWMKDNTNIALSLFINELNKHMK